jgi:predicted dehydrogenase
LEIGVQTENLIAGQHLVVWNISYLFPITDRSFMMTQQRRDFLKTTAAITATMALPASAYSNIRGANEAIRLAVIGTKSRGQDHINGLESHVVALCDCDSRWLNVRAREFERKTNKKLETYTDFRKVCENKDIDAVSVATPNHTHSIIAITAAQNEKDVYCEKPVSHNVWEGRQLVNAARKYNRIIQCGTQSRSSPSLMEAVEFVRSGKLGKIKYAIGTCFKPRQSIGKLDKPLQIAKDLDYELWCGPAEKKELYRPSLHYDWHWDFNTGNGDMGNQGIHQMDIARWFLGESTISPKVLSIGGRLGYDDAGNTPNTQTVIHLYENAPLIFETRGLPKSKEFQNDQWGRSMDNYRGSRIGVIVQCENGHIVIPSYSDATAFNNDGSVIQKWGGGGNHYANFIAAVGSRKPEDLNAEILEGHLSSALCHTGGMSHQLGERATANECREAAGMNELFAESFDRMNKHLQANGINTDQSVLTLGAMLEFETKTETAKGNDRAQQMLTREYREPFVVPDLG